MHSAGCSRADPAQAKQSLGLLLEESEISPKKSFYLSREGHYPAQCQSFQNAQQIQNITGIRTASVGTSTSVKLHTPNPSPPQHAMSSTLTQKRNELSAPEMGYCTTTPTGEVYHSSQNQLVLTTVQHRSHAHQCAAGGQQCPAMGTAHSQPHPLFRQAGIVGGLYSRKELIFGELYTAAVICGHATPLG